MAIYISHQDKQTIAVPAPQRSDHPRQLLFYANIINFLRIVICTFLSHTALRTTLSMWLRVKLGYFIAIECIGVVCAVGILANFHQVRYRPPNCVSPSLTILITLSEGLLFAKLAMMTNGDVMMLLMMLTASQLVKSVFFLACRRSLRSKLLQVTYLLLSIGLPTVFYSIFQYDQLYTTWLWVALLAFYNLIEWGIVLNVLSTAAAKFSPSKPLETALSIYLLPMFFVYATVVCYYFQQYEE